MLNTPFCYGLFNHIDIKISYESDIKIYAVIFNTYYCFHVYYDIQIIIIIIMALINKVYF